MATGKIKLFIRKTDNLFNKAVYDHPVRATSVQREYAIKEEKAMIALYPLTMPAEERKFSTRRNLQSYLRDLNPDYFRIYFSRN